MEKIRYFLEYLFCKFLKKLKPRAVKGSFIHPLSSVGPGSEFISSSMDKHSYCGYDCRILDTTIGSFCSIANNTRIGLDGHSIDWTSTSPVFNKNKEQIKTKFANFEFNTRKPTHIGHDVWIGENALIMPGLKIGTGAIIGAGSVVTKNIPAYEIWAGAPAKLIRKRFKEEISKELLSTEWWHLDKEKLTFLSQYIQSPEQFIEKFNEKPNKINHR